ncbi:acyltransferase [Flavobacteriaceae bacterium]|nr:acyltransferase [Flavobacteriaceae bacterium]
MKNHFIHKTSFIEDNVTIGQDCKIWHFCNLLHNTKLGYKCSVGQNCVIGPNVILGNNVKVQNNVSIYEGVECEDDVFLGPSMVFTNVINPRAFISRKNEFKKTLIKKGATIGANATIVCGNTIGEFSLVGSGSVVTKDVKPYALVIGVPAKQVGWVSKAGNKLIFDSNNEATDDFDLSRYRLIDEKVIKLN